MEALNLNPCPFCAGKGRMVVVAPSLEGGSWKSYVLCTKCKASTEIRYGGNRDTSIEVSMEAWNQRA